MHVITPITITDAMLLSTNVAENDYAVWSSGTTYALGNRVIVTASGDHHIYESLQASNTNHDPKTSPTWWLDLGADNRWSMFDGVVGTRTSAADQVAVTIQPGSVNSLAFVDCYATNIDISISDGYTVQYQTNLRMDVSSITDWYSYFYAPITRKNNTFIFGLPTINNAQISISLNAPGETAYCGVLVAGAAQYIGLMEYQPKLGITDYSTKDTDGFGNVIITKRAYSKRMDCTLFIYNYEVDSVYNGMAQLRSTPAAWVGSELFDSTMIYGYYKDFSIMIEGPTRSTFSLDIEGLI